MLDGPPFVLRLMLATLVGAATILLALVRPHKRTVEDWLLTILYYHVHPKRRVHQTATLDDLKCDSEPARPAPVSNEQGNFGTLVQKRKLATRTWNARLPTTKTSLGVADTVATPRTNFS